MLFNSYLFIFGFLPVTLAGFYLLGLRSRNLALAWLIVASLVFYAWWRPFNVMIIAPAVAINFGIARLLQRLNARKSGTALARSVLLVGVALNIAFLGYFKYANFASTVMNDLAGTHFVLTQVILPLGISFITFQKIAFLIDVHSGRIQSFSFRDFCLFVLFFPQLIAGPIVHYREMMPQFQKLACKFDKMDLSVGLTLFIVGLFKKVVLADGIAAHVTPIYDAAQGASVSLFPAWIAAIGFTLQIYFDFSGYSDMALGLGRFFGIRLPANFNSPLKATNIVDFWLRWHITLTRFLTAYLFNPLVLWLTRRRLESGRPGLGGRQPSWSAFFQLLVGPTILTMLVSGVWHGAGYLFILWGLLHGLYLSINHGWRIVGPPLWSSKASYLRFMLPVGSVLTFVCVVTSMVLFRSSTGAAASAILKGMWGLGGIALPQKLIDRLGPLAGALQRVVIPASPGSGGELFISVAWVVVLLAIAWLLPNSLQWISRYEPAIGIKAVPTAKDWLTRLFDWRPTPTWAFVVAALAITGIVSLGGKSEFLYWQF
jgi:D-alanyl-lipoteichoic acid acyltransferase DltB (MBOAT superfamily)